MMTMQGSPKPLFRKGSHASTCNEGKGTECSRKACTGPCFLPQKRGAPYNGSLMPMLAKDSSSPHTPAYQPGAGAERHKGPRVLHSLRKMHPTQAPLHTIHVYQRNATY